MALLEDLKKTVEKIGERGSEALHDAKEVAKLKSEMLTQRKEITKKYSQLGKELVREAEEGSEVDDRVRKVADEIKQLKLDILEKDAKLREMPGVKEHLSQNSADTFEALRSRGKHFAGELEEKWEDFRKVAMKQAENVKDKTGELMGELGTKTQELAGEIKQRFERDKSAQQDIEDGSWEIREMNDDEIIEEWIPKDKHEDLDKE